MKILEVRRAFIASRGWYILETTVALTGMLALILSASDIVRLFHARNAVRVGVTDGLRCLYPTGEACPNVSQNGASPQIPLYRASYQAPGGYELPRTAYSLSATWLTEPVLEASRVNRALRSVKVTYAEDAYQNFSVKFPVDAHAIYLVKTRDLPHVEANSNTRLEPNQRVLKAVFTDPHSGVVLSGAAPAHKLVRISHIRGHTTRRAPQSIGEVSFTVDDAWPSRSRDLALLSAVRKQYGYYGPVPCYQSSWAQGSGGPRIAWPPLGEPSRCAYQNQESALFNEDDVVVPIMFRISGDRYETTTGSRGSVSAVLEFQRNGKLVSWPIGGRMFDAHSTNADFVVRGAGQGFEAAKEYFDLCDKAGYSECVKYSTIPLVPRGSSVKVKFFVEQVTGAGSVGWAGDAIQLFYPQFELGYEKRSCGMSSVPDQCADSVAPMRPLFARTDVRRGIMSAPIPGGAVRCLRSPPTGAFRSDQEAIAELQGVLALGVQAPTPTSFWAKASAAVSACGGEIKNYDCSDLGVEDLQGCAKSPDYSETQLLKMCGVRDFIRGRDRIQIETISEKVLPNSDRRLGCSEAPYPPCAQPFLIQSGAQLVPASVGRSCSLALPHTCQTWEVPPYFDVHTDTKCPDIRADLAKEYRSRCAEMPSGVEVSVVPKPEEPLIVMQSPSDLCQKVVKRSAVEVECAAMVPFGVAQGCCRDNPSGCRIDQVTAGSVSVAGSSSGQRQALAVARAQDTILTAYPRARFNGEAQCAVDAKHCTHVQVSALDGDSRVSMSASMQVPLVMLGWLGFGGLSQVSYTEERIIESSLVE